MWKKQNKRKHIFILLYRWETWTQDATGALFTHQQQTKGWSFYIVTRALTSERWRAAAAQCVRSCMGSHHTAHWGETSSLPTHMFRSQQSREHTKYYDMTKDIVPNTFELWIVSEHLGFFSPSFIASPNVELWIDKFCVVIYVQFTSIVYRNCYNAREIKSW